MTERSNPVIPVKQRIPSVGSILEKMDRDKDAAAGGCDSFSAYRVDAAPWRLTPVRMSATHGETPNKMHLRRLHLSSPGASWQWELGSIIKQES